MTHEERRERRKRVAEFVTEGGGTAVAVAAACRKFKISYGSVRLACREFRVHVVDNRETGTTAEVVKLLADPDLSHAEIARRCGVSRQRVSIISRRTSKPEDDRGQ